MFDGRLIRTATVLALLLFVPAASAAVPASDRPTADGTDGQDITDMGADPTGQFVAAVVAFDAAKTSAPVLPIGGGTTTNNHKDVYICDYGTYRNQGGTSCRGLKHSLAPLETPTPNAPQRVAVTYVDAGGRAGLYAVVGPDSKISLWSHGSDTALWSTMAANLGTSSQLALNVTLSRDATRVVVGAAPTSPTAGGSIEVRFGNNGTAVWTMPLQEASGSPNVRPTSLDYARTGGILAIGTTAGVLFANPDGDRPSGQLGGITQAETVSKVQLSNDGQYVVASSTKGVFFAKIVPGAKPTVTSNSSVFNRDFASDAHDATISGDGSYFAAAAGNALYFYHRLDTASGVEPIREVLDLGTRVASIDMDEKGHLLVAVAGNTVFGFDPRTGNELWRFDATQASAGTLDVPLRKVSVSDDAQRILVAGKTRTMAYSSVLGATATLSTASGQATIAPTQTSTLTLTAKNIGSLVDNLSFQVKTPVGWPSASANDVRLKPDETGTVQINVTAPIGQAPGVYAVLVNAQSEQLRDLNLRRNSAAPSIVATTAFNFTIQRSVVLKVEAPDARLLLRQGGEQTVPVVLKNEGNAEGVVNLSVRQELTRGASWDVRFEGGDQVRVPASGSKTVNMIVGAPSDAGSGDRNVITIRAKEGDTVEATDQVTAYVDAQFGAELRTNKTTWEFYPGQVQVIRLNVTNIGNTDDVYNLTGNVTPTSVASDWRVTIETPQVSVPRGATKVVSVSVKAVASDAREASLTLRSVSQSSPDSQENSLILNLLSIPRPPTEDPNEDKLLPAPAPLWAALLLALVALGRSRAGGRP